MSCLDAAAVQGWIDGALGDDEREAAAAHVDQCDACRRLISSMARSTSGVTSPEAPGAIQRAQLDFDTTIDRFRVTRYLGKGGMGIVYAAHDPELRRDVAIKLLRDSGTGTPDAQARLLREAQAMAQVAHPNVIAVYDVGTWAGEVFVAMELATGGSLRAWCANASRAQILDAYIAAGRGLAAAHQVGLVHRDFKPDNVLVGADGRIRVTDFGLARSHDASPDSPPVRPTPVPLASLTKTGTVMGTPGYMAAELYAGRVADARTDQFAFCVALWEALFRDPPYRGDDEVELAAAVLAGKLVEPRSTRGVPGRVSAALRRGLAVDPAARWPTMDALLAALAPARRLRWWLAAAGVIAVAGVAVVVAIAMRPAQVAHRALTTDELGATPGNWPTLVVVEASEQAVRAHDVDGARELAATAVATARTLSPWALLHALTWQATEFRTTDDSHNEEVALREARRVAEQLGDDRSKTDTTVRLADVLDAEGKTDEAKDMRAMGLATAARPDADALTRAGALEAEATTIDDPDQARVKWDEALALRDTLPGAAMRSMNRVRVGTALFLAERYVEARAIMVAAIEVANRKGTDDPAEIAVARMSLYQTLALADIMLHRWPDVDAEARKLQELTKGFPSPEVAADAHEYLGVSLLGRGDTSGGRLEMERALAAVADPIDQANAHTMIATFEREVGLPTEGLGHARAAFATFRAKQGDEDPATLRAQLLVCKLLVAAHGEAEARPIAETVVTRLVATHALAADVAEARFVLARTLPASEHARAVELATQARDVLKTAGSRWVRVRRRVDQWFANPDSLDPPAATPR